MARERVVTRTIEKHEVIVKVMVNDESLENRNFVLTGDKPTIEKALKIAHIRLDSNEITVIKVIDIKSSEDLYGELEEEYLKHAVLLDPVTRRPMCGHW